MSALPIIALGGLEASLNVFWLNEYKDGVDDEASLYVTLPVSHTNPYPASSMSFLKISREGIFSRAL